VVLPIFFFFTKPTKRWKIFKDSVNISVKSLCETRWECRLSSVKAVRFQIKEIHTALLNVADNTSDAKVRSEALSLAN
jgi:hypothetical protein